MKNVFIIKIKAILLLLIFSSTTIAQKIEDLKKEAQQINTATAWNNLSEFLFDRQQTDTILFVESTKKAYSLALKMNDSLEISKSLLYLAEIAYNENNFDLSISKYQEALSYLKEKEHDKLHAVIYNNLAYSYGITGNFQESIENNKKAIHYKSKYDKDQKELAVELNSIATSFSNMGLTDSALYYVTKALDASIRNHDTLRIINCYNNLGVLYKRAGNFECALEHYNKAVNAYQEISDMESTSWVFMNISSLYHDSKKFGEALFFSRMGAQNTLKYPHDRTETGIILNNHSGILAINGFYPAAIDTAMLARKYVENNAYQLYINSITISDAYFRLNRLDSCEWYIDNAESILSANKQLPAYRFYKVKGSLSYRQNQYEDAIIYFEKYVDLMQDNQLKFTLDDYYVYNYLSEAYAIGKHNFQKAFLYKDKAYNMRDSLLTQQHNSVVGDFYVKYKTTEKELEISKLNEEKQRIRTYVLIISTVFIIVIILFIIALLVNRIKRIKKENEILLLDARYREKELEYENLEKSTEQRLIKNFLNGQESERKALSKELHDTVANKVFSIIMQNKTEENRDAVNASLENIYTHIRQISHQLIPPEFKFVSIPEMLGDYIGVLNEASKTNFILQIKDSDIERIDNLDEELSKELYYIIQEAIGNILKHSGATEAEIFFYLDEESKLELIIKDNGKGFNPNGKNKGIGLRTMKDRSRIIDAELKITSSDKGTTIRISLPISDLSQYPQS